MTLIEKLIEAGYPREEMYHHYSDLYIFITPLTTRVIDEWFKEQELDKALFVEKFRDQITGRPMYSVSFQYIPYWEERSRQNGLSEKDS